MKKKKQEVTGTEELPAMCEVTCSEIKKISRLDIGFDREDLNKVVGKINELIDKSNGSV